MSKLHLCNLTKFDDIFKRVSLQCIDCFVRLAEKNANLN